MADAYDACFVTILPLRDNDGVSLDAEAGTVLAAILERFGAFTADAVEGGWKAPDGAVYRDASRRVTVFCHAADRADARGLVADAGRTLRQEAMFFEFRHPADAEVIPTPPAPDRP